MEWKPVTMGSKARSTLDGHASYAPRLANKKSQLTFSAACIVDSSQHWHGSGVYSSVILSGDMQWYWILGAVMCIIDKKELTIWGYIMWAVEWYSQLSLYHKHCGWYYVNMSTGDIIVYSKGHMVWSDNPIKYQWVSHAISISLNLE